MFCFIITAWELFTYNKQEWVDVEINIGKRASGVKQYVACLL